MIRYWTICGVVAATLAFAGCGDDSANDGAEPTARPDATASAVPARTDQPVGERLIDVGGYKLAIRCQGHDAPTVIVENGAFPVIDEFGNDLSAEVAREHRVCTYDRAGTGKSDPGPNPRDGKQISEELDILLTNAGEAGPFVLVTWSVGGLYTPLYAIAHPDDVAGMVFIDPRTSAYQLEVGSDPRLTTLAADLPPAYREELRAWDASASEVRDAGALPARPLIVLTAGSPESIADADTREGGYQLWSTSHADLAASVPGGQQVTVDDAAHEIWDKNPQAVLDAIREVAAAQ